MKVYCKHCESFQPATFLAGHDALTGAPYEDLRCDTCFSIVTTVHDREALEQPAQPLTDEQIFNLAEPFGEFRYGDAQGHKRIDFARTIEAAHGITGEQPAPAHEADELTIAYMSGVHEGKKAERKRMVNLLMIQHEAAKGAHNYWQVAANLIQAEVASDA